MATVTDLLNQKGGTVVTVAGSESVLRAANLMNEQGIGGVVVRSDSEIEGIFTERDVMRRVVAAQRDPAMTQVRDVMTSPVVSCRPEMPLSDLGTLMTTKRIRHVPVQDQSGLLGIVTSGDVLAYQVRDQAATIEHLNSYIYDVR